MLKKLFQNKTIEKLQKEIDELVVANSVTQGYAYLVGIERSGRVNRFIFRKNGTIVEIETMGLLSDNINEWKKILLDA